MEAENTTAKKRYEQLVTTRHPFLERARRAAELTIPSLLPRDGHTGSSELPTPYQSIGARGVNNISSKLLLALLPANSPFFRLVIDEYTLEQFSGRPDMKAEVDKALSKIERSVMSEIEATAIRVTVGEGLRHLVVGGNILFFLIPEGGMRAYRLDRYVCKRDPDGNILDIIALDKISYDALPEEVREGLTEEDATNKSPDKTVELYTHVYRDGNKFKVYQEACGKKIAGSDGSYPVDNCPWLALRLNKIDGEDYGRGHVEEYIGDLISCEGLSRALLEGTVASAKGLVLVNPNGVTDAKDIEEAPNWAVREGKADDVTVVQGQKAIDLRVGRETLNEIIERLSYAFLLNSAIQRNAERVTAEEIRFMAGELEDVLGGVYSILSVEFQLPFVKRLMATMTKKKKLPPLPKGVVKPAIVTGIEAIGRGHDLNKLTVFLKTLQEVFGPEALPTYIHADDAITRLGTSIGVEMDGLVKTKEEQAAAMQQEQQQQMMETLGPNAINAGGKIASESMKQGETPNG